MPTKFHATRHLCSGAAVPMLPNGDFLIPCASVSSDDYLSTETWSHYAPDEFNFSPNITIIAAATLQNSAAVVVRKRDPSIPETIEYEDPDGSGTRKISF